MRLSKIALGSLFLIAGFSVCVNSQDKPEARVKSEGVRSLINGIPSVLHKQYLALGKRMLLPGKERTIYSGQLFEAGNGSKAVRVIHQKQGWVRLEGFRDQASTLAFDGKEVQGLLSREEDESLIETFAADSVEGLMNSIRNGASIRLLGNRFKPDSEKVPDYKGPGFDIYEVTAAVACRQDKRIRMKRYYFDSDTGLLHSTQYYDLSATPRKKIETRYSAWGTIDGSQYPARIERYVDGQRQFDFISESIVGEAAADTDRL